MRWSICCLIFFFSSASLAQLDRSDIENILPSELIKTFESRKISDVEKTLKQKITKKENDALYLNYFGTNGDVTLGVKNNKVSYIYVKVPSDIQKKNIGLFEKAYDSLSPSEKSALNKKFSEDTSHQKGRFTEIDLSQKSMRLEFNNDESRSLRSIVLWPLGEKLP